ncbi:hypothetical protein CPG37_04510 [Malaciobacter canalis]|uniref:DUF59 domain-containing protein n=1 Tax=Malaciobacter canalis TaxID=1912871 RepID=A0ABX4LQT8_9BACT|nr:hypothetical protein [Malaciobacter canalis]PHO10314.1 hypothetical protein CPG37_04510 [Malaciobacter canalis]QEE32419.1 hypothetical protein ACAN_0930 [Malaciobacter canalis]
MKKTTDEYKELKAVINDYFLSEINENIKIEVGVPVNKILLDRSFEIEINIDLYVEDREKFEEELRQKIRQAVKEQN